MGAPRYISTESGWNGGMFIQLMKAGYTKFKFVKTEGYVTGPFGEFAYDRHSRFAWRTYDDLYMGPQEGDLHAKFDHGQYDSSDSDHILSAWKRAPEWPLAAASSSSCDCGGK